MVQRKNSNKREKYSKYVYLDTPNEHFYMQEYAASHGFGSLSDFIRRSMRYMAANEQYARDLMSFEYAEDDENYTSEI